MRTKIGAYFNFFMGVLGPSVSFLFPDTAVTLNTIDADSGTVSVDLGTRQQMVAGLAIGCSAGGGISIAQQIYLPSSWRTPWKFEWKNLFELSLEFELDLIALLIALILELLGKGSSPSQLQRDNSNRLANYLTRAGQNGLIQSFKFYANATDSLSASDPEITATPTFTVPWDFMKSTPATRAFMEGLDFLGGEVQFGPCLAIAMPVTLGLTGFTVHGGRTPGESITYEPVSYQGTTATADGPAGFPNVPDRFTTNVAYSTGFTIELSCFFKVSLAKVFSFTYNSKSLDIANLLLGEPFHSIDQNKSVETEIATGCILVPQMTMEFQSDTETLYQLPVNTVVSGVPFAGIVTFSDAWSGGNTSMSITITPPVAGFPTSVPVSNGNFDTSFKYTFPNQYVLAGDPNRPDAVVSPNSISPYQSFEVTASLPRNPAVPCDDYEVTVPVKLLNRFITTAVVVGPPGLAPVWNAQAGAQLNANSAYPPEGVANSARVGYSFDFFPGETGGNVPMTITLYTDQRNPHASSDVSIAFDSGPSAKLSPSAHLSVPLPTINKGFFTIQWLSASSDPINYSTVFYLVLDAGAAYGRTEFWLEVWNWK